MEERNPTSVFMWCFCLVLLLASIFHPSSQTWAVLPFAHVWYSLYSGTESGWDGKTVLMLLLDIFNRSTHSSKQVG